MLVFVEFHNLFFLNYGVWHPYESTFSFYLINTLSPQLQKVSKYHAVPLLPKQGIKHQSFPQSMNFNTHCRGQPQKIMVCTFTRARMGCHAFAQAKWNEYFRRKVPTKVSEFISFQKLQIHITNKKPRWIVWHGIQRLNIFNDWCVIIKSEMV